MTEHNPHLRRTLLALLLGCALAAGSTASASAAVLKADYGFDNTLASSVLPAPDIVQAGTCPTPNNFATETVNLVPDPVLAFDAGCGLQLDTSTLVAPGSYSFAIQFRFTDVAGFRRVFDSTPGLLDHGLYVVDGRPDYYLGFDNVGPEFPVVPNQYGQLVVTRDAATQEVIVYFDGVQEFSFTDGANEALIDAAQMPRFLLDDGPENSAGAISRLRVYDAPLTPAEVAALDGNALGDVSITTTDDIDPAYAGLPLGYSIAVTQSGPAATAVTVTDPLPTGVDFVSASPGCAELNRVVTCDLGTLVGGPTVVNVVVRPTVVNPALANTATVTTSSADGIPTNNSSTATTDVRPPADVSVAMTVDASQASVGQTIGYTVAVANHGPGPAQSVVTTDPLSADVDFVSASPGCVASAGVVTCDFGTLPLGASASRRVVVRPSAPDPQMLNTATVQSITGDVNLDNNFSTTLTEVRPVPVPPLVGVATPPAALPAPGLPLPQAAAPGGLVPAAAVSTAGPAAAKVAATTRAQLLRRGLRFTQRFRSGGSVRWTLELLASGSAKTVVLGSATRTVSASGTVNVTLKLSSTGRRALARRHTKRLRLRTSFKPAGSSRHVVTTAAVRLR